MQRQDRADAAEQRTQQAMRAGEVQCLHPAAQDGFLHSSQDSTPYRGGLRLRMILPENRFTLFGIMR
jgi:hypothetical protein